MLTWGEGVLVYLTLPGKLSTPGSLVTASSSPPAWIISAGCYCVFQVLSWLATKYSPQKSRKISRWRGFHAITQPGIPAETNIGYHPMINAEASNFITFDLPLYANAKQLQLKYPEEFKNTYQNRRLSRCLKVPFSVKESMQIQAWNTC